MSNEMKEAIALAKAMVKAEMVEGGIAMAQIEGKYITLRHVPLVICFEPHVVPAWRSYVVYPQLHRR